MSLMPCSPWDEGHGRKVTMLHPPHTFLDPLPNIFLHFPFPKSGLSSSYSISFLSHSYACPLPNHFKVFCLTHSMTSQPMSFPSSDIPYFLYGIRWFQASLQHSKVRTEETKYATIIDHIFSFL